VLLDAYYWLGWKLEPARCGSAATLDGGRGRPSHRLEFPRDRAHLAMDVATTPSFFFVPSLLSGSIQAALPFRTREAYSTAHWGFDLAILIAAFLLSMVVSAVFLETLGEKVRDRNRPCRREFVKLADLPALDRVTLIAIALSS